MPRHGSVLSPERVTAARLFAGATFKALGPESKTIPHPGSRLREDLSCVMDGSTSLAASPGLQPDPPPALSCLFSPSGPVSVSDKQTFFILRSLSSNIFVSIRISNSYPIIPARFRDFRQGLPGDLL